MKVVPKKIQPKKEVPTVILPPVIPDEEQDTTELNVSADEDFDFEGDEEKIEPYNDAAPVKSSFSRPLNDFDSDEDSEEEASGEYGYGWGYNDELEEEEEEIQDEDEEYAASHGLSEDEDDT